MSIIGVPILLILVVIYVMPAVLCGRVARGNGLEPVWLWMVLGLVFSWVALLILAVLLAVLPPSRGTRSL